MESKFETCWKCGLPGVKYDADMRCRHCGEILNNYCPNDDCTGDGCLRDLEKDDKVRPFCGHPSAFAERGYFDSDS